MDISPTTLLGQNFLQIPISGLLFGMCEGGRPIDRGFVRIMVFGRGVPGCQWLAIQSFTEKFKCGIYTSQMEIFNHRYLQSPTLKTLQLEDKTKIAL